MIWTTKDGKELDIKEMSSRHLLNTINYLTRANEKGVPVGGGVDIDEIYFDIDYNHFDDEIKAMMNELQMRVFQKLIDEGWL